MKKQLLNNWPLKLVSVLLAVGIWMMVIYITDPATTQTYSVPIELVNEEIVAERGRSVTVVGDQTVNVRVTKNRSITRALSASNFRAVADFSKMYEDTQVPVTVTCTSTRVQASDFTQDKFSLEVKLEDLKTVTVPIVYELNGDPAEGFAIGGVTLTYGKFITAVINFLLIALVLFCIIKAMNKASESAKKLTGHEDKPAAPTTKICPYCKSEIPIDATRCPHCTSQLDK